MKQVRLLIAFLAVVFAVNSAFSQHAKFTLATYSFIAGSAHPENASAWTITTTPPTCLATTGHQCLIVANQGIGNKPDQSDVTSLASISANMTQAKVSGSLIVKVKP